MPTSVSAGVGDHPYFLTFYNYDPKLQNFPYTCKEIKFHNELLFAMLYPQHCPCQYRYSVCDFFSYKTTVDLVSP